MATEKVSTTTIEMRTCLTCKKVFQFFNYPSKAKSGRGRYCSHACSSRTTGKTHGHTNQTGKSPTYRTWQTMLRRCTALNDIAYHHYGGRGITIHPDWFRFECFLRDMGERPKGTTLDRYPDNDGNYAPGNCRWATKKEQNRNMRSNVWLTYQGRTQCMRDWCVEYGIAHSTFRQRRKQGWDIERILMTPIRYSDRRMMRP